ncbi:hypothetical protein WOLCODRAFT_137244 [Wolfiporia cocos MD-104 SS10]|uniref:Transcription initiation factor IIF subunit alpha n=1 Tax=Wolfiporia cocos (strain MD-104) TaxID=742152 RepID=A0A2H3JTP2_WOLCO|nr:hypothetical protein WOLCODRAFT_137244 [Wolfiporia cocos MD-104 SS10]
MAPKKSQQELLFHPKKKRTGADLLFHPKKRPAPASAASPAPASAPSPAPPSPEKKGDGAAPGQAQAHPIVRPRAPRPKPSTDVAEPPPPEGPYAEYRLLSSALNGWKYDVMKFDSRRTVDIASWAAPVKLNRKEPRREGDDVVDAAPQPVGPMLGPDGKPVIGIDGKIVMVDSEGRPIRPGEASAILDLGGDRGKDKVPAKKRFQRKTKQVFMVPDAVRQLRKEERFPWVMEDAAQKEVWVGKMEEASKSETYAMFMPAANDIFKFVPAHRWYKFQKKPSYRVPTLEEAESLMARIQKNKDPERWLLRKRNGQGPSEATAALFKAEREGSTGPITASGSLGPGGRRLQAVDNGTGSLFGDDDDEEGIDTKRRRERELGAEGDIDEFDFEETFQDDEEKMEPDADDEETKELEERLKREYRTANKTREGYIDESEEEDDVTLTRAGKTLQKTLQKHEKDGGYEESDEENPYASEPEEEEEEPIPVYTGPAIIPPEPKPARPASQPPATPIPGASTNGVKAPTSSQPSQVKTEPSADSLPIPTSPVSPSLGGHSVVAMRATSPKAPKPKHAGASRAGSPLAGVGSTSPTASRATSPVAGSPTLSNGTGLAPKLVGKRKATDDSAAPAKPKKRKAQGVPEGTELKDSMVIEWLRNTPGATTRDCIHHFTPYLTDEATKQRFTALVKEVAQLSKGVLVLRPAYREDGAGSPAPAATPAAV